MFFILLGGIATFIVYRLTAVIRISVSKFRYTFEKAPMGIAQLDSNGHILVANTTLCEVLNYHYEDLLYLQFDQLIHQEDRDIGKQERQSLDKDSRDSF